MKRHPFAPQVIACYRITLRQRARRAVRSLLDLFTTWRT